MSLQVVGGGDGIGREVHGGGSEGVAGPSGHPVWCYCCCWC